MPGDPGGDLRLYVEFRRTRRARRSHPLERCDLRHDHDRGVVGDVPAHSRPHPAAARSHFRSLYVVWSAPLRNAGA